GHLAVAGHGEALVFVGDGDVEADVVAAGHVAVVVHVFPGDVGDTATVGVAGDFDRGLVAELLGDRALGDRRDGVVVGVELAAPEGKVEAGHGGHPSGADGVFVVHGFAEVLL